MNWATVRLVAGRELSTRVRSRSFLLGTATIVVLLAGSMLVPLFLSGGSVTRVGFIGQATAITEPLQKITHAQGTRIEARDIDERSDGERQVREGTLDALVVGAPDALTLIVDDQTDSSLRSALDLVVQQQAMDAELAKNGLNPVDVRSAVQQAEFRVTSLQPPNPGSGQALAVAITAAMLLYFFLITSGQAVAQGIVEEKSSRVVELLLSTIRPAELLAGKVLGIGLTMLLQFCVLSGAAAVIAAASGMLTLPSGAIAGAVALSILWFVLGFFFYATILVAAASLVSRMEDLQNVVTPVLMLQVVPFLVGMTVLPSDPESGWGAVLSFVPGFSPVLVPMRVALGTAATWEVVVAITISVAATASMLRLGGRIYSNAILRTGARVKLTDALKG